MRRTGLAAALFSSAVLADVKFTSPAAGAHVDVGTIDVQWKESGIAPPIVDLTAYTLALMVGGNDEKDMQSLATFMSQGDFSSANHAQGTIPSGIAGPVTNGFFFKIISSSSTGGIVINYSERFSITGLTGITLSQYREAAEALNGSTDAPGSVGDSASSTSAGAASTTATSRISTTLTNSIVTVTKSSSAKTSSPSVGITNKSSSSRDGGLSTSVLVGIAIAGAAIGFIGIGLAIWAFLRKKRRKEQGPVKLVNNADIPTEVARKEMVVMTPVELHPYARIVEADDGARRPEMDSTTIRAELEGDSSHFEDAVPPVPPLTPVPETPIENLTLSSLDQYTGSTDTLWTPVTPRDNV